jgi:hypothetical protein
MASWSAPDSRSGHGKQLNVLLDVIYRGLKERERGAALNADSDVQREYRTTPARGDDLVDSEGDALSICQKAKGQRQGSATQARVVQPP